MTGSPLSSAVALLARRSIRVRSLAEKLLLNERAKNRDRLASNEPKAFLYADETEMYFVLPIPGVEYTIQYGWP